MERRAFLTLAAAVGLAILLAFTLPRAKPAPVDGLGPEGATPEARPGRDPGTPPEGVAGERIARRCYEELLQGRRSGVREVLWYRATHEGRAAIRDVTTVESRRERRMGGERDLFAERESSETLRGEEGDLISLDSRSTDLGSGRVDSLTVVRVAGGYRVTRCAGDNTETFEIPSAEPAMADAEAFLQGRIARGEAPPGSRVEMPLLDLEKRTVGRATLEIVGPDEEGPGLKVVQRYDGSDLLLWFGGDGAVVRLRAGDFVIRRADQLTMKSLPARPASFDILIRSDRDLPRLFTGLEMEVEMVVRVDETVKLPVFPENPFTVPLAPEGEAGNRVRLLLKAHDAPEARATLPIEGADFAEHLKPTLLMEVDHPRLRAKAREIVGDETDARRAAERIADFVFRFLEKGSPPSPSPSALEILDLGTGDCSEHALLFTALCRAAGIPARQCSGLCSIGPQWGYHGWAEIWVGAWIGADPTTNEIGTRARYIFCARPDEPQVRGASILAERTSIRIRRARYLDGEIDFSGGRIDPVILTGVRCGALPHGWSVRYEQGAAVLENGASAFAVFIQPDQGYRAVDILARFHEGGREIPFRGRPAIRDDDRWIVPLGRQNLCVYRTDGDGGWPEEIPAILAPTVDRTDG